MFKTSYSADTQVNIIILSACSYVASDMASTTNRMLILRVIATNRTKSIYLLIIMAKKSKTATSLLNMIFLF